jgi:hypothetical protein
MAQLELLDRTVRIRIISDKGHQSFIIPVSEVSEFISNQSKKLGLCLYVHGVQSDARKIDINTLACSQENILTKALVGG